MISNNLFKAFDIIKIDIELPEYLDKICDLIIEDKASRKKINDIINNYQISSDAAKVEFLHLIFAYIKIALDDDMLGLEERQDIKFLKVLFGIQQGDFCYHNKFDVEETIRYYLAKIYNDNFVSEEEAELKIGLQEIFDLSFDEMNNYTKVEAAKAIRKGIDPKDLDVFFTYDEYFKLKPSNN